MQRRSFLKSTAALVPAAALEAFAISPSTGAAPAPEVHVVGAGQDRLGESHSLGFSTILFKVLPRETNGGVFIIEHTHLVKGGPPLHYHPYQEEWFFVMEGEVLFQIGGTRSKLSPGESALGPRNIPHTFTAVGERPATLLIAFSPAGKMEEFFRAAGKLPPHHLDAEFFGRYDVVVVGPPLAAG